MNLTSNVFSERCLSVCWGWNIWEKISWLMMSSSNGSGLCYWRFVVDSRSPVDSHNKGPVTRALIIFNASLNKRLSKLSSRRWSDTQRCPSQRHCNVKFLLTHYSNSSCIMVFNISHKGVIVFCQEGCHLPAPFQCCGLTKNSNIFSLPVVRSFEISWC